MGLAPKPLLWEPEGNRRDEHASQLDSTSTPTAFLPPGFSVAPVVRWVISAYALDAAAEDHETGTMPAGEG